MRSTSARPSRTALGLFLALALAACDRHGAADLTGVRPEASLTTGAVLVECPADTTLSASATIGPLGGTLSVGGHRISIPMGAVVLPVDLTLTVPASSYMEVDIRANGAEHFEFRAPVTVTIDYSRCSRSNIDRGPLSVWYIDTATKTLIEDMGGVDDKVARTVTFGTDHLSGYSIAQ